MNSRIINLALRHSLFATIAATAYANYDKNLGHEMKKKKKYLSTTDENDCNNGVNWKRDKIIIDQAFKDAGWQRPVYVAYDQEVTGVFTATNENAVDSAYVSIKNEHFPHSDTRDLDLYAAMGHEAIHVIHNDSVNCAAIKGFTLYLTACFAFRSAGNLKLHELWLLPVISFSELPGFSMFLLFMAGLPQAYLGSTIYATSYLLNAAASTTMLPLLRYQEIRADKESATILGTATTLADLFERKASQKKGS